MKRKSKFTAAIIAVVAMVLTVAYLQYRADKRKPKPAPIAQTSPTVAPQANRPPSQAGEHSKPVEAQRGTLDASTRKAQPQTKQRAAKAVKVISDDYNDARLARGLKQQITFANGTMIVTHPGGRIERFQCKKLEAVEGLLTPTKWVIDASCEGERERYK